MSSVSIYTYKLKHIISNKQPINKHFNKTQTVYFMNYITHWQEHSDYF